MTPYSTLPPRASRCLSIMNIHGARPAVRHRRKACMGWSWAAACGIQGRGHIVLLPTQLVTVVSMHSALLLPAHMELKAIKWVCWHLFCFIICATVAWVAGRPSGLQQCWHAGGDLTGTGYRWFAQLSPSSSLAVVKTQIWRAPWQNRIYWYISFFCPSLNRVLFQMFCLLVEGSVRF